MKQGKTDWQKPLTITAITRKDLFIAGFPRWQLAGPSEKEMNQIALQMGISYGEAFFLEDLEAAMNFVLCKRTRTNIIREPV